MMKSHVRKVLEKYLFMDHKPIVAGVSGGPDSIVLLHVIGCLNWPIIVGYLDHGIRDNTIKDAEIVERVANEINAKYVSSKVDVPKLAKNLGTSFEAAGRIARYQFLFGLAESFSAQGVVVGHTADDQVETVLMNFIRGAGRIGLTGMLEYSLPNQWSDHIPLIRPLLSVWRQEIVDYCNKYNLESVEDLTNFDLSYSRNRIRHEVIPFLENINPQFKTAVFRTSRTLADENKILQLIFNSAWRETSLHIGKNTIRLNRKLFNELAKATQRAILIKSIKQLKSDFRVIEFDRIETIIDAALTTKHSTKIDLGSEISLFLSDDEIWLMQGRGILQTGFPQLVHVKPKKMPIPGVLDLSDGWRLIADWESYSEELFSRIVSNNNAFQCWIQLNVNQDKLVVRARKLGDRIIPLGMGGRTVKISDLMINLHLPQPVRARWPLICLEDEIVWVPGYTIAENFRVTNKNAPILHLSLSEEYITKAFAQNQEFDD